MGEYEKHIRMAREKLEAIRIAFEKKQHTVVGDLATKVVEQLVEADAAEENTHFGTIWKDIGSRKPDTRKR